MKNWFKNYVFYIALIIETTRQFTQTTEMFAKTDAVESNDHQAASQTEITL